MRKLLCLIGFHKWVFFRWFVKEGGTNNCDMIVCVKKCRRCKTLRNAKLTQYYKFKNQKP
jgi:hypothetical protein